METMMKEYLKQSCEDFAPYNKYFKECTVSNEEQTKLKESIINRLMNRIDDLIRDELYTYFEDYDDDSDDDSDSDDER